MDIMNKIFSFTVRGWFYTFTWLHQNNICKLFSNSESEKAFPICIKMDNTKYHHYRIPKLDIYVEWTIEIVFAVKTISRAPEDLPGQEEYPDFQARREYRVSKDLMEAKVILDRLDNLDNPAIPGLQALLDLLDLKDYLDLLV